MRTEMKYGVGVIFKHPWLRNDDSNEPMTCMVTQTKNGVVYFRGYRPDRTLTSWTGKMSEGALETHFVLRNALRTGSNGNRRRALG